MSAALKPAPAAPGAAPSAPAAPAAPAAPVAPAGQNLSAGAGPGAGPAAGPAAGPGAPHAVPMSPVSQNMAQMAQNMSHHGNLSHVAQPESAESPPNGAGAGALPPAAAGHAKRHAPLSLVQERAPAAAPGPPAPPAPLALTRTPERREAIPARANGTADSPKPPPDASPQNPDPEKAKEKTPKSNDAAAAPGRLDKAKVAMEISASEKPERTKEPSGEEISTAHVEPDTLSGDKNETAKLKNKPDLKSESTQILENYRKESQKPAEIGNDCMQLTNDAPAASEAAPSAVASTLQFEQTCKSPVKTLQSPMETIQSPIKSKGQQQTETAQILESVKSSSGPKKSEVKKATPRSSTLKLATVSPAARKRRQEPVAAGRVSPAERPLQAEPAGTPDSRLSKRNRTKVQPYQSPTPELAMATKLSVVAAGRATPPTPRASDDKLTVFYKNEYLAVRNAEGGFYVCQAMHNVYRSTRKIKIRWLSQDKTLDPAGDTYKPDFYDTTDMECVLTTLSLARAACGGGAQVLGGSEAARVRSILERALAAEQGGRAAALHLTEEHPDGLDLSLYKDESQLEKRKATAAPTRKRRSVQPATVPNQEEVRPAPNKRGKTVHNKSPKSARVPASSPPKPPAVHNKIKRKSGSFAAGVGAGASKTATAPVKCAPSKPPARKATKAAPVASLPTPPSPVPVPVLVKRTPTAAAANQKTSKSNSDKESKAGCGQAQAAAAQTQQATPSTSGGKSSRTPRKPPSKRRSGANSFILR